MINKNIKLPLYYQLAELIIGQIESEEYAPGDMIPSERELMFSHVISRATVRQAIDYLVNKKYLIKKHGKGTFVSNSYYRQKLFEFYSFTN
ncbi:MAG: GntR family transcriptional regulator, partial [bacterium]|nr:GntR family transcriptional regulator [bacterium]